ncbi:hypothetical protein BTR23_20855 [Alkalihalophilus pseudofirmus]|nr:hypothetical protein BTR23_20855 [Alkalihalophilus pseudofirmus]
MEGFIHKLGLDIYRFPHYNNKSVINRKNILAFHIDILYNIECWSVTAMMRKVADTPGPIAMAGV